MKKFIVVFIISLFLLASSVPSWGSDWVYYFTNNVYQRMFFDGESINQNNDLISVWERTVNDKPESLPGGKKIREVRTLHEINCSSKTMRLLQIVQYLTDGTLDTAIPKESAAESVTPGSMDERLLKAVCQYANSR